MSKSLEQLEAKVAAQQTALNDADEALKVATDYVAATQPKLDQFNVFQDNFAKRAHQTAGALAARGIIQKHETDALVEKLAEDPLRALDLVEKVAGFVSPAELGETSDDVRVAGQLDVENMDAFSKLAVFGTSRPENLQTSSGMVD